MEVPPGPYDIILADPPWLYDDQANRARPPYSCMTQQQLRHLHIPAKEQSVLLMWATGPKMVEALELIEAWGFVYKTVLFVWNKTSANGNACVGLGHYTRPSCEFLLVATRGQRPFITKWIVNHSVRQLLNAQRREHSRKPDEIFTLLQTLFVPGLEKLEMFAREPRPGWDAWGNQTDHFGAPDGRPHV